MRFLVGTPRKGLERGLSFGGGSYPAAVETRLPLRMAPKPKPVVSISQERPLPYDIPERVYCEQNASLLIFETACGASYASAARSRRRPSDGRDSKEIYEQT
jgi:hypothetical protein